MLYSILMAMPMQAFGLHQESEPYVIVGQPPVPIRAGKSFVTFIELKCCDLLGMLILHIIKKVVCNCLFVAVQASPLCAGEIFPNLFGLSCEGNTKRW
jgi:hypothetical protein